ncbi:DUF962-domain-containing protein [Fomitiporia mediterranea MF3/22]|uniref:DUF962-domain-containing protein n=1 Tax=Fomitiporia mediterranea (strain MF3/22) TaxID=694068 RepID=UPI00044091F7|nr:DUF962-domain-containing protein [Fomitiporia mediterranea MF3/22]EJD00888.1 DUF962-domain-containing protein [Fomitiporia mediterranea MF3/22]
MPADLFNVEKQLVFYGAYHSNKVNVRIHMVCVPILIWTFQIMLASLPTPSFFPECQHDFNSVLSFKFNWATVQALLYFAYYFTLLPSATLLYAPQSVISLLSAIAVAHDQSNVVKALALHVVCWLAQFYGHGVHERRAPALLDNLIGGMSCRMSQFECLFTLFALTAVVLAPFFVHLELLFELGYFPTLHRNMKNGIGKEVLKFRTSEAQKKRAS